MMAAVLGTLGSKAAYVVYGADGLDELSTTGVNRVSQLRDGRVTSFELDPATLGLPRATLSDLVGGTPEENAQISRDVLGGQDQGPRRDVVVLNAAAGLSLESGEWESGLAAARQAIDSGAALHTLERWLAKTQDFSVSSS
jgi:anthranilate phosphoribosyltransferase